MAYIIPQVRVFQEFALTPNDVTQNLNPAVIGPNYQLIRYKDKNEREQCASVAYDGAQKTIPWRAGDTGSVPDTEWFGVTLVDTYAHIGDVTGSVTCLSASGAPRTKFELTLDTGKSLSRNGQQLQFGVAVVAGDYVGYTSGGEQKFSKILNVSCGTLKTGERSVAVRNKKTGEVAENVVTVDATGYTGEKAGTVNLSVTDDGKITWSSSILPKSTSPISLTSSQYDIGNGVKLSAGSAFSTSAGNYTITIKLVEPYSIDTVTLADALPAGVNPSGFYRYVAEAELDKEQVSATGDGVSVNASATVRVGSYDLEVASATAVLSQRNLLNSHTDSVYTVSSDSDIVAYLGTISPDNPLAYGAHVMLLNSAGAAIRYIAVESDDATGWAKALERASLTTDIYAICPMTEDKAIIESVVAHCNSLSSPEEKSWRIAFFSQPTDRVVDVTPYGAVEGVNVPEQCRVIGDVLTCYGYGTTVESVYSRWSELGTVKPGDVVEVVASDSTVISTTVKSIESNTQLVLASAVAGADSANCAFTIRHTRTVGEYVAAIAATSTSFHSRRAYNVWPNTLRASDGNTVSGMYGAAAACALACSVQPQQPITNVEIRGFSDVPDAYSLYSRAQLNDIAAGGTLILMQEKSNGEVYVRHQISTAYSDGNINATELSLTKNLDSISYYFANSFAPYIGRYNLTEDLLTELRGVITDGLAHLESATETNKLIGPQVIAEGTELVSLAIDPVEKDHAYANISLNLPKPFNNFDLHLQVI